MALQTLVKRRLIKDTGYAEKITLLQSEGKFNTACHKNETLNIVKLKHAHHAHM
jgi:hypothetical protein